MNTMTDEAKRATPVRFSCPHLGLVMDQTVMLSEATLDHRCYVAVRPGTPDLGHQKQFCLCPNHLRCALYIEPPAPEVVTHGTAGAISGGIGFQPQFVTSSGTGEPASASIW